VTTRSDGLRVYWSGAYRIAFHYFDGPTSPVANVLQSGTYVFGVKGGRYGTEVRWDPDDVVSLPGKPRLHMDF
jgi:hypothetical protein